MSDTTHPHPPLTVQRNEGSYVEGAPEITPASITPIFESVMVEPSQQLVITGLAQANTIIDVMFGDETLGQARSNEEGIWILVPDSPLPPGGYQLSLGEKEAYPTQNQDIGDQITLIISKDNNEIPIVLREKRSLPSELLQGPTSIFRPLKAKTATDKIEPAHPDGVRQQNMQGQEGLEPDVGQHLTITAIEADEKGNLAISGHAQASTLVKLYFDNVYIGQSFVSENGKWLLNTQYDLQVRQYEVTAELHEPTTGAIITRYSVPFRYYSGPEQLTLQPLNLFSQVERYMGRIDPAHKLQGQSVIVKQGDNLWTIARRVYGSGIRYTTIYKANQNQIQSPDQIYPGQRLKIPVLESYSD